MAKYYIATKGLDIPSKQYLGNALTSLMQTSEFVARDLATDRDEEFQAMRQEIRDSKPDVILSLGSEISKLLDDKFRFITSARGKLLDYTDGEFTAKMVITYSPKYLVSEKISMERYSPIFFQDLEYAVKYANHQLVDIGTKNLCYARTYQEFKDYYDRYLADAEMPAYDIETNAKDPRSDAFRIIGYSLAPNGSTGIYIIKESLEYRMPDEDWTKCVELTKQYISSRTVLVHNIMYERPATLNEWGIKIENFEDSLIKARLLLGGKTGAGLKEQCARNLGYPDWDTDLHVYLDSLDNMKDRLKPTPMGKARKEYAILKERGFKGLLGLLTDNLEAYGRLSAEYVSTDAKSLPKEIKAELDRTKLDSRLLSLKESMETLAEVLAHYYEDPTEILELVGKEAISLVDIQHEGVIPYSSVPMNVITKYGALDSVGTQDLNEFLSRRMDKESTPEVDLWKGYKVIKANFLVGTEMELHGLYWNDRVASDLRGWLADKAYDAIVSMLRSGFLDRNIFENSQGILLQYVKDNELDRVREILGDFDLQKSGIKLKESGKRITWNQLLGVLGKDFIESHYQQIVDYVKANLTDRDIYPDYTSLTEIFNPSSNLILDTLTRIFMSKELKIAHALNEVIGMLRAGTIEISEQPNPDRAFYESYLEMEAYNRKIDSGEAEGRKLSARDIYDRMAEAIDFIRPATQELRQVIKGAAEYSFANTSEATIVSIFESLSVMGCDIEDESTWTDQFRFLINFRTFKKCIKMISVYLDGDKVGRGSVWVVDREDLLGSKPFAPRKRRFSPKKDSEEYLMQASWGVCSAGTLRWRGGIHTLPAGPMVKGIYTSRYKGGVIAAPDYSQQEIRTISGLSNCLPLLEAYRNGEDVHMKTAMSVFKKPKEEITKNERRFCKSATFAILYGATVGGLANLMSVPMEQAQQMMDGFFGAYPELKVWMEARRREVDRGGKVSCSKVGYFLDIDPNGHGGIEEAYKQAGNYPVQGQSSLIAGYVLNSISQYLLANGMKTVPISFIHDSLEFDIHPRELFVSCQKITSMMNDIPNDEFGIPSKAELTIGLSMGDENEVTYLEETSEGGIIELQGYEDDLDAILANWRSVYSQVDYTDDPDSVEEVYVPRKEMFMPKLTISRYSGTNRRILKRRFVIRF